MGLRVTVASNSRGLLAKLGAYFGPLAKEESASSLAPQGGDPGVEVEVVVLETPVLPALAGAKPFPRGARKATKEWFVEGSRERWVQKQSTGLVGIVSPRRCIVAGQCERNLNQVINAINAQCLARYQAQGWLLCHAAAVSRGSANEATLLIGEAGAGKSTLLLHLLEAGYRFLSNDRVLLGPKAGAQIRGVAKWPRVNPGTLLHHERLRDLLPAGRRTQLCELPQSELRALEDKHDVFVVERFGRAALAPQPAPLGASLLLSWKWDCSEPTRVEPLSWARQPHGASLVAKAPGALNPHGLGGAPKAPLELYAERLAAAPVRELRGGVDFKRAVQVCLEQLHS